MDINPPIIDALIENQRRLLRLPGLTVAVVVDGRIAYLRGLGLAGPGRPMTAQTPLIIGSLSKSFTALAVMQLVEAGMIDLDAPVKRYIPWLRFADSTASEIMTTRHLLTHTSGISRYAGRALLAGRGGKTIEQSVRDLRGLRLSLPVGAGFQYSNTNYLLAGLIVEVVSGQKFSAYVQQHILTPLGMENSAVSEAAAVRLGLASGYRWWFGVPRMFNAPYLDDAAPAAFLAASVEDMGRYALALLNRGSLDGTMILSPAGVADLHQAQVTTNTPGSAYGLGWRIEKLGNIPVIRHGGEVSNFLAEMILLPEQNAGVVVLMNCNNGMVPLATPHVPRLAAAVARLLLGLPQPRRRLGLRSFYVLLDAALLALSIYQGWSLVRVWRARSGVVRRWLRWLAALGNIAVPVAALRLIPRRADSPWSLLRVYVPDVSAWLAAFSAASLLKALLRLLPRK